MTWRTMAGPLAPNGLRTRKRQPKCRRQLSAEAARSKHRDWHIAVLSGHRFHNLTWSFGSQVCAQFFNERRKVIAVLSQTESQRAHCLKIAARSSPQAQIDSPRIH